MIFNTTISVDKAKGLFFDRAKVLSALDRAEARFMSRFGAFVRSDARRSMRKSKSGKPSKPGRPPKAHSGELKRFLFFVYDRRNHDVVIGPIRLPRTRYAVPGIQEFGGVVTRKDGSTAVYPERPYMRPALKKNLSRVRELRNSIR